MLKVTVQRAIITEGTQYSKVQVCQFTWVRGRRYVSRLRKPQVTMHQVFDLRVWAGAIALVRRVSRAAAALAEDWAWERARLCGPRALGRGQSPHAA